MKGYVPLALGAASLCAAVTWQWMRPVEAPVRAPVAQVSSIHQLDWSASVPGGQPWHLGFELAAGESLSGVCAARLCRLEGGVPVLREAANVVFLQRGEHLDLKAYADRCYPTGERALFYALRIAGRSGEELRVGWTRFAVADLELEGIRVAPRRDHALDVRVVTEAGQPVPGAMVSIDDAGARPGTLMCFGFTDPRGRLQIAGLGDGRSWTVALPFGIGPWPGEASATARSEEGELTLRAPLRGAWRFARHEAQLPGWSYPVHVREIERAGGGRTVVWATSPWIGAGTGPRAPFYLMSRQETDVPERVDVWFTGFREPVTVRAAIGGDRVLLVLE